MSNHCYSPQPGEKQKKYHLETLNFNIRKMKKSLNTAKVKAQRARQVTDSINVHQLEIYSLIQEISSRQAFLELSHQAAVKIQKVFRGFLVRSAFDEEILKIRRKAVFGCIVDLDRSDKQNLSFTGRKPIWAGLVLTRFAKRLLFLFKIKRISKVYAYFRMIKEIEGQEFLRKTLQIFWAKTILDYKKFLKFREVRLKEIHRNVAVLTIKKYFSSNCITFSVFMRKVKKFKRMIKMCKSGSVQSKGDMYSTKDQSTVRSDVFDAGSNGELRADDLGNIMECASLTSTEYVELEKARREKIQNGLICYNIQRNKEPLPVLPYLYQKDILEEHSPPSHYTVLTSCLVSRMTTANPQRQNPKRHLISPKALISERFELPVLPQTPKKIIFTNENLPNFTRPTQSSLASRSKDETFMSETPKSVGNYREHSTLFNQTFSGMQKLMDIKRQSISSHKRKEFREGRLSLPVDWLGSKGNVFRARTTLENFRK